MAGLKLVCIGVVCMVLASAKVDADISCSQVVSNLSPCISAAKGGGGPVPAGCCTGIRNLNNAAKTTPDRQDVCRCMQTIASQIKGLNFGIIASLPGKCGVSIPYTLSPSTDCNGVK